MKTLKITAILLLLITGFNSCKKVEGPKGDKGDQGISGPSAKEYDFTLTFGTSASIQTFSMPKGSMYGNVTFVYLEKGYKEWIMLPYYENNPGYVPVNYIALCNEISDQITIRTDRGDNVAGSPWAANNVQKRFKAVVIETSGLAKNPNVDWKNYDEVKTALNL